MKHNNAEKDHMFSLYFGQECCIRVNIREFGEFVSDLVERKALTWNDGKTLYFRAKRLLTGTRQRFVYVQYLPGWHIRGHLVFLNAKSHPCIAEDWCFANDDRYIALYSTAKLIKERSFATFSTPIIEGINLS